MKLVLSLLLFAFLSTSCRSLPTQADASKPSDEHRASATANPPTSPTPKGSLSTIPIAELRGDEGEVQEKNGGGLFCADYIASKIKGDNNSELTITRENISVVLDEGMTSRIATWLEMVSWEEIEVFSVASETRELNLLKSRNPRATGLATSLTPWVLDFGDSAVSFTSLLKEPTFIFWKNDRSLTLYTVQFNGDFVIDKDWENMRVDIISYEVSALGKYRVLNVERNVACEKISDPVIGAAPEQ